MSILKYIYDTPRSLLDMYAYITQPTKTIPQCVLGINISPNTGMEEISLCRSLSPKVRQKHQYQQIIFCFDQNIELPLGMLRTICIEIGEVLGQKKYQVLAAIHFDTPGKIHYHYIIHNLSIYGDTRQQGSDLFLIRYQVDEVLKKYNLSTIK